MTIYYSATTNAFYDSQVYNVNNIPEDKVAVSASTYSNLMAQQCAGRVIVAAADGTPTTIAQTCGPCTSTKYATKTELTNGLAAKANDSNVVHKTGDETINGVKSFGSVIKATNGTVQVGADTGYSVTFNYNGNITSKQARGTYNIFFPEGSGTLALTSDIDSKANDSDVVHTSGDENISGNKYFTQDVNVKNSDVDIAVTPSNNLFSCFRFRGKDNVTTASLQYSQRTYGVNDICFYVSDADSNSHGFRIRTDNILEPIENNTYSLGSSTHKWAKIYSDDVVHTSGTENISGNKVFRDPIFRKFDITTNLSDIVYRFEDSNNSPCGYIQNNVHYWQNNLHNRHVAHNNTSGKDIYLDIISRNNGTGTVNIGGDVTSIDNISGVTSDTNSALVATMGWVNNPETSTNVVHRSGDETIAGNKTFSNRISFPSGYYMTTDANDNSLRISRSGSDHGNNYKVIIQGDTGKIFAPNGFKGSLQGNADTATSAGNGIDSSGTNYIKFKDGTQICWGSNKGGDIITFANAFTATPCISFGYSIGSDFERVIHGQARYSSSTSFIMQVWDFNDNAWTHDRSTEWVAIGRWK